MVAIEKRIRARLIALVIEGTHDHVPTVTERWNRMCTALEQDKDLTHVGEIARAMERTAKVRGDGSRERSQQFKKFVKENLHELI